MVVVLPCAAAVAVLCSLEKIERAVVVRWLRMDRSDVCRILVEGFEKGRTMMNCESEFKRNLKVILGLCSKNPRPFLSLGSLVDVYFPPSKRSRVTAPFVVSEFPNEQPSIKVHPDECQFEIFRCLGGEERSACASVDESAKPKGKVESVDLNDEECVDVDPQGYLSRCLEGKKASDVDIGLKVESCGCPSLGVLSMWNISSVSDEGLSAIATGCRFLEKLDLSHCLAITDKAVIAAAMNCPNLRSVKLKSCSNIGDESLNALGRYCPNLESIMVKNCTLVGDQGIVGLFSAAAHVLTKANLHGLNISDVPLAVIGHYGSAMTDLSLVGLHNVNERGFWVMGKGQGSPDLNVFCLQRCALVSDNGVVSFSRVASLLESIKLDETHRITQCGFGILASCGGKLKALALSSCLGLKDLNFGFPLSSLCMSLRSLAIHNCPGFGDSGMSILVAGIACLHGETLEVVNLERVSGIADVSLMSIATNCSVLRELDIFGCRVTDSGILPSWLGLGSLACSFAMESALLLLIFFLSRCGGRLFRVERGFCFVADGGSWAHQVLDLFGQTLLGFCPSIGGWPCCSDGSLQPRIRLGFIVSCVNV
ncbi:hypothetical protein SASPL_148901 [Salvia splendens]|uniref:F-box/LRR-repeat protein 15-like leucin rich repeat domain-containing protein n=1 Tax=Salvia splendens TaxID=180675 RepID=A0A8X8WAL9_SALSN|nr:hypothetical protein SASPL_148901 [Salvia splendens]